jgi:hypothetical protein
MWLRLTTLSGKRGQLKIRMREKAAEERESVLVDVVGKQRRVENEGNHLERDEEGGGHEGVCDHLGENEL